jgi:hypothetical protein
MTKKLTLKAAGLALALAAALAPGAAAQFIDESSDQFGDQFDERPGYDVRGGDYQTVRTRSARACRAECERDPRCRAFAFDERREACYLKERAGTLERRRGFVAGIRGGVGGVDGRGRLTEEVGVDYRGGDYADFRARDARACRAQCADDARCQAYTYNLRSGVCYLKDRVGAPERRRDTVAGVRGGGRHAVPIDGRDDPFSAFSLEVGYDYRGGDYTDFRSRDARACREQCADDARCQAYTYNTRSGVCYLKDRVGSLERRRETVTGARGRGDRDGRGLFREEYGYDIPGGDYADFRSQDARACREACGEDRRCQAYTYNLRSGVCYLKDRVGDLQRRRDTVSGVRGGGRYDR